MKNRILIVEDELDVIDCLMYIINLDKWECVIVKDFSQAKDALIAEKFDLVITDFSFPGGNGNQVAIFARNFGVNLVWLHTGNIHNEEIKPELFNCVFHKLEKELVQKMKAA